MQVQVTSMFRPHSGLALCPCRFRPCPRQVQIINRGASPFWPQHRDHLFGRNVVAPVWYAALATTVAAALAAAVAVALAAALAAALDAALADAAVAAALGTAHTAAVSSIARRVGKGRVRETRGVTKGYGALHITLGNI